LISIEKKKS